MANIIELYGYIFLLFIVSCIGFARYKKLSLPFKILAWSVLVIFLSVLVDQYFVVKYRYNYPVLQLQSIEEYVFYSMVYYYLFKNETIKKFIVITIVVLLIFFPINAIFLQPFLHKFPTNINNPAQILYAAFSLLLFKEMLEYPLKIDIVKQSIFWFNSAMLFYGTTLFFMLGLSNYLSERGFEDKIISDLWWFIDYLFHILICIALLSRSEDVKKNDLEE